MQTRAAEQLGNVTHRPLYTVLYGVVVQFSMQTTDVIVCMSAHRCKNFFYVFYFDHVFC